MGSLPSSFFVKLSLQEHRVFCPTLFAKNLSRASNDSYFSTWSDHTHFSGTSRFKKDGISDRFTSASDGSLQTQVMTPQVFSY